MAKLIQVVAKKRWSRKMVQKRINHKGHKESSKFTKNLGVLCAFFVTFVLKIESDYVAPMPAKIKELLSEMS